MQNENGVGLMNVLTAENITKSYEEKVIIEDVSLYVKEGEIVSLLGVSGVGKSTLFNILAGLLTPDSGEVFLEGERVTGKSGLIGYMQQDDLLLPFKTVVKNVMIPLVLKGMNKKDAKKLAMAQLEEFSLAEYANHYPGELSGGMRQRAALARTFLYGKKVMLADEPFSALDAMTRRDMQIWYKEKAREKSLATLVITHDIDEALFLSDRVYVLAGETGKIVFEDKVSADNKEILKKTILEKVK